MESLGVPETIADRYLRRDEVPGLLTGARVFRAHDEILDREVLVVVPETDDVATVLDAARRGALVNEPELVKVLDVGEDGPLPYIVTDAPTGEPLTSVVGRGPLTGGAARAVVGPLATAIDRARRRGVHHGAVGPGAVFVGKDGPQLFGLGFAGTLAGADSSPDTADRRDTQGLVEVLYLAVTGSPVSDPVVPASAVREVPADLDTIITTALIEHTGPRHPQELANAVTPWRTEDLASALTASSSQGSPARETTAAAGAGAGKVQRTSVKGTTSRGIGGSAPGTPPPASQPRVHRWTGAAAAAGTAAAGTAAAAGSAAASSAGANVMPPSFPPAVGAAGAAGAGAVAAGGAAPMPPVPPAPRTPAPVPPASSAAPARTPAAAPVGSPPTGGPAGAFQSVVQHPTTQAVASDLRDVKQRAKRFGFNPTPVVLVVTIAALGWATLWAFTSLTHGLGPIITTSSQSPRATAAATTGPSASADASSAPTATYDPPVIDSGTQLDPDGDDNEHPEMVDNAFDGDLQTFWMTRTYQSANFGGINKRGIGLALTLEEPTLVSKIYLTTGSTGGKVQIRDTTADDPTGGTLLASGSFDGDFSLTLDKPVVTDHVVIWITELPKDEDGNYVVRVSEVSLS